MFYSHTTVLITNKLQHHESKSGSFLMLIGLCLTVVVSNWFSWMPIKRWTHPGSALKASTRNAHNHVSGLPLEGPFHRTDGYWCNDVSTTPIAFPRSTVNKQSEHLVNESTDSDVPEGSDLAENSRTLFWDFSCVCPPPICVNVAV